MHNARSLLVALVALTACSDAKKPGTTNDSCAAGQVADGLGTCRTLCAGDGDCATGEACSVATGLCLPEAIVVPTCDEASCPNGYTCPEDGGADCVPLNDYCAEDSDCNFGERCDGNRCISRAGDLVETCAIDAECPIAMTCQLGVCFGCIDDLQCQFSIPGSTCVLGTCVTADLPPAADCLTAQCAAGERCNPINGLCEPTCTANEQCAAEEICAPVLQQCVADPGCTGDDDCVTPGLTCLGGFAGGICTGCTDTIPCRAGLTCILGSCLPDLGATACDGAVCDTDEACDPQDGSCYPANGSCASDADCRTGHTCNLLGLCSGCSVDGDCRPDQRCLFATCIPTNIGG